MEYTGEIITQEESERRMIEDYKDNNVSKGLPFPERLTIANILAKRTIISCFFIKI